LAKFYKHLETDYGIIPKYNLKFIAFGGEEYGYLGAKK
jgi:Zn-dependent M28 family amino/carboxypeptidase